jgi:hypothetical protein
MRGIPAVAQLLVPETAELREAVNILQIPASRFESLLANNKAARELPPSIVPRWWLPKKERRTIKNPQMRNTHALSPLRTLKNVLVSADPKPRHILTGPFRGIRLNLSLRDGSQIYLGLFERETYPWLKRLSEGIGTAVDIGSSIGEYLLYFVLKTGAHVFAFEPNPQLFLFLDRNLSLNGINRDHPRLTLSRDYVGIKTGFTPLDSLVPKIKPPCLIKMDVDGYEVDILKTATRLNQMPGIRWLIETHSAALEEECTRILSDVGFQTRVIDNGWWRWIVPERRPSDHCRWLAAWNHRSL